MASASNLVANPTVSKTFDFVSADVFCPSYSDELNHDVTTANRYIPDPSITDYQKSRMASSYSPTIYDHRNESLHRETINAMESCVKRHTDDILRFLEGISSRLSHLESYCYNVDKSVGEMQSNLSRDYEETGSKLTSLEKKLAEVGRSVQILRDKKELAETQKELVKLQIAKKKLSSTNVPRRIVEHSRSSASDISEAEKQHLAIILSKQGAPEANSPAVRSVEVPRVVAPLENAPQRYYLTSAPLQVNAQGAQGGQYLRSDTQCQSYQSVQQDLNLVRSRPVSAQVCQQALPPLVHRFFHYQQPWPQQSQPQQMYPSTQLYTQKPTTPVQRLPNSASAHLPHQPSQQHPQEVVSGSVHMTTVTTPLPDMSSQVASQVDTSQNGYVCRQAQPQQLLTQQMKANYGSPLGNGYASAGSHQSLSTGKYIYRNEDTMNQPPYQSQCSYTPANVPAQLPQHASLVRNQSQSQFAHNNQYTDLTEKLVNMGFRTDHIVATIHKMEDSGQAVDFNAVAESLNAQSLGFHTRWTG